MSLTVGLLLGVPHTASAQSCPSVAAIKDKISALVTQLRADVPSRDARRAARLALVQSLRTFRGADADTPAERAAFGQQIAALAQQLKDASGRVERKALVAAILALTEQRERGPFTAAERTQLHAAVNALRDAVVAKLDTAEERRAVTRQFRIIHDSFTC